MPYRQKFIVPYWFADYVNNMLDETIPDREREQADQFIKTLPKNFQILEVNTRYWTPSNDVTDSVNEYAIVVTIVD